MTEGKQQVRVDVGRVMPLFADESMVVSRIKSKIEEGKKAVQKEGLIELIFLDQLSQPPKAISRIVISRTTAEGLHKILGENLEKLGVELKSKKMPKPKKAEPVKKVQKGYLG